MPNKGRRAGRKSNCRKNQLELYKKQNREHKNKVIKLKRHLKKLPLDLQAKNSLELINK